MSDRVYIFDTTLRDGEQSPGCSMTVPEKLRMARKLVELGVDILEAGFPDRLGRRFRSGGRGQPRVSVGAGGGAGARLHAGRGARRASRCKHARRPRIHTFIATSDIHLKYKLKKSRQQVLDEAVAAVELARRYVRRRGVFGRRRHAHRSGLSGTDFASGGGRRRAHGEYAGHGRLFGAGGIRAR